MRQGYERMAGAKRHVRQNLVLCVGLSLLLVTTGEASPKGTAGIAGASDHAVQAFPVAVSNQSVLRTAAASVAAGGFAPVRMT